KRFQVLGITRDKEYDLTTGTKNSSVLYFSANPNGEAEVVTLHLSPTSKAKIKQFDFDFAEIEIKGRQSQGNIVTKYPVKKISIKREGVSTLPALSIWYDETIGRLNTEGVGTLLGKFKEEEKILVIYKSGEYELTTYDLSNRYENTQIVLIEKFDPNAVLSVVYYEGEHQAYFVKRFHIETITTGKRFSFIGEAASSKLLFVTTQPKPIVEVFYKNKEVKKLALADFVDIKGWKSLGNKLTNEKIQKVQLLEANPEKNSQLGLF
ncbi:MAG: DNA gyrase/topoisomerase IV subunit A, partial [Flammeovirgaceae bacterium]|nr:DNA gyrase/topoisomerase IV subunit A [Flammeovirgaceae bacterium]MDW8288892.1 DNA gyrase/topoisomerase IV subunit A [Flammeovirgaceae bacterium]